MTVSNHIPNLFSACHILTSYVIISASSSLTDFYYLYPYTTIQWLPLLKTQIKHSITRRGLANDSYDTVVVQSLSCLTLCDPMDCSTTGLPFPSLSPGVCSNSCPLIQWCHPTISFSVATFSSHPQSFPTSESLPMSQLFTSGGQSIGVSNSASALPMNIQGLFPFELTGLISLLSKGLSGIFSTTRVWKHQFFSAQSSLWSNSHIHTWLLGKP